MNYLVEKQFGGYAPGLPAKLAPEGALIQMYNSWGFPDLNSQAFYGIITTLPAVSNYKAVMPVAGRARGLFQYLPTVGLTTGSKLLAFQCVTDYSASAMYCLDIDTNAWSTLLSGASAGSPYHMSFTQYSNKVYMCNGDSLFIMRKYHPDFGTNLPVMKNKANQSAIAGATLTWNLTTTVTSNIDISAIILPGAWIRRSSTSPYWDEVKTVAGGGLSMTLRVASSDTGASTAGGAQQASDIAIGYPRFSLAWKDKLWFANDPQSTATGSRLWWSLTGNPENYDTTLGSGYLDVGNVYGEQIVGLIAIDDYLFVFKDNSYYVYYWTGDLNNPIQQVRVINQGCVSNRTIKDVGGAIIYFTGSDLRITDGTNDISLSDTTGFAYIFKTVATWSNRSSIYFSLTAADNNYPWATFDEINNIYTLFFGGFETYYDVSRKMFIGGNDGASAMGHSIWVLSATSLPVRVAVTSTSTNQLVQYSRTALAKDTNGQYTLSKIYDFGLVNQDKRVYWVEFEFHPKINCNTVITFNYWDGGEKYTAAQFTTTGTQTYTLAYAGADANVIVRQRFVVNDTLKQFGWSLKDTSSSGTDGWGINSWTIAWEPYATT